MSQGRLVTLDSPKQAVVEAQLMDHLRLDLARELGVEHLIRMLAKRRGGGDSPQEVRSSLPSTIEELRLIDQGRAVAHCVGGLGGGLLQTFARLLGRIAGDLDMAAAVCAQPLKLLTLVSFPTLSDELCVRVSGRPRSATLSSRDRQSLLGQMRTGQVVCQVRRGEDQRVVRKPEHETVRSDRADQEKASHSIIVQTGRTWSVEQIAMLDYRESCSRSDVSASSRFSDSRGPL